MILTFQVHANPFLEEMIMCPWIILSMSHHLEAAALIGWPSSAGESRFPFPAAGAAESITYPPAFANPGAYNSNISIES